MIGLRIKYFRKKAGVTQKELAKMVGITNVYLSRIETGHSNPHIKLVEDIALHLKCKVVFVPNELNCPMLA